MIGGNILFLMSPICVSVKLCSWDIFWFRVPASKNVLLCVCMCVYLCACRCVGTHVHIHRSWCIYYISALEKQLLFSKVSSRDLRQHIIWPGICKESPETEGWFPLWWVRITLKASRSFFFFGRHIFLLLPLNSGLQFLWVWLLTSQEAHPKLLADSELCLHIQISVGSSGWLSGLSAIPYFRKLYTLGHPLTPFPMLIERQ